MRGDILISTTAEIPGYIIKEYKDIVFDRVVVGAGFLTEFFAGFTDVFGGRAGKTEDRMDELYTYLMRGIREQTRKLNANAVIGVSIDIDEISGKGTYMLMISGTGTAVVAEPIQSEKSPIFPSKRSEPWKCIKCSTRSPVEFKFCPECGEPRHYNWRCSACNCENLVQYKFCPECGKQRENSEDLLPELPYVVPNSIAQDFSSLLDDAASLNSSAEILNLLETRYAGMEDDDFQYVVDLIRKNTAIERTYGNNKISSMNYLSGYIKNNLQVYSIDRSQSMISCPVCGCEQKSDRHFCRKCSAVFRI